MTRIRRRRAFLRLCLAAPAAYTLAACGQQVTSTPTQAPTAAPEPTAVPEPTAAPEPTAVPAAATAVPASGIEPAATAAPAEALAPTPACGDDDDDLTPAQTEGPYFKANSPERTSFLEAGVSGTKLLVTGVVQTTGCEPVARALLEFWHADDAGAYDNTGFRMRGHQFTDDQGRYTLETVVPGLYPGRTRHIHVKVQAPGQPVLTTQLYFPGEPDNARDGIYDPALEMGVQDVADGKAGTFDFVLA